MPSSRLRAQALPARSTRTARTLATAAGRSTRQSTAGRETRHASLRTYAEPSSADEEEEEEEEEDDEADEDDEDDDDSEEESDSEDELGDADFTPYTGKRRRPQTVTAPGPVVGASPAKRPRRQPSGSVDDDVYLSPASDHAPQQPRQRRREATAAALPSRPARSKRGGDGSNAVEAAARKRQPAAPQSPPSPAAADAPSLPWTSLPYYTLSSIFEFAAAPLDSVASARWLVAASRTCRAFAEPALRALYTAPPMLTVNMAHGLVDQLTGHGPAGPGPTMFDYRLKVRTLRIDVGSLASHVYKGRHLDIAALVAACPRLTTLDLYHYKDMPPFKLLAGPLRWAYPPDLFRALGALPAPTPAPSGGDGDSGEAAGGSGGTDQPSDGTPHEVIRLQSWSWNRRMLGPEFGQNVHDELERILALHLTPAFSGLRSIRFVNFQRPSLLIRRTAAAGTREAAHAADVRAADQLAALLAALPQLRRLEVESSTAANELLLPQLPATLEELALVNCQDVDADALAEYLVRRGQALQQLTLHHNRALSLGFLPVLGEACPQLQRLAMNLTYFSHSATPASSDNSPRYAALLAPDQVPTWPPALVALELEHLRRWEPAAATVFFQSLVDAAPRLPHLRVLAIKAMVDVPWRQRTELREHWASTLRAVYARPPSPPPEPARSLGYYAEQRRAARAAARLRCKRQRARLRHQEQRRSGRLAEAAPSPGGGANGPHSLRAKTSQERISYREPDTDDDAFDDDDDDDSGDDDGTEGDGAHDDSSGPNTSDEWANSTAGAPGANGPAPLFLQGLCDVVDIRIDNQKPGEIQYRMGDFLDSDETGSDEEWTGDDGFEDTAYAW